MNGIEKVVSFTFSDGVEEEIADTWEKVFEDNQPGPRGKKFQKDEADKEDEAKIEAAEANDRRDRNAKVFDSVVPESSSDGKVGGHPYKGS